jgi:hypothetical protein
MAAITARVRVAARVTGVAAARVVFIWGGVNGFAARVVFIGDVVAITARVVVTARVMVNGFAAAVIAVAVNAGGWARVARVATWVASEATMVIAEERRAERSWEGVSRGDRSTTR